MFRRTFFQVFVALAGLSLMGLAHAQYIMPGVWQNSIIGGEGGSSVASLRFRDDSSTYLHKTFSSASNRKTWTYSAWVKPAGLTSIQYFLFQAGPSTSNQSGVYFNSSGVNNIGYADIVGGSAASAIVTDAAFRDPSAWMHIVFVYDSTQATSTDRIKIYVNGEPQTATGTFPPLNQDSYVNSTQQHFIGQKGNSSNYFDGHMTEVHFVDGQALEPSDFAEENATTKAWQPKAFAGTYGTNGFHLDFADSADLGDDNSGNGHDWTPSNFTAADGMKDQPDENFATLNPLYMDPSVNAGTLKNGNLRYDPSNGAFVPVRSTILPFTKTYWEVSCLTAVHGTDGYVGMIQNKHNPTHSNAISIHTNSSFPDSIVYRTGSGAVFQNGSTIATYASCGVGETLMFAYDPATKKFWVGLADGTSAGWFNSGNPAAGTGEVATLVGEDYIPAMAAYGLNSDEFQVNFGQSSYVGTPPSGFRDLSTKSMPTPTIADGADYFKTVTYTGNGGYMSVGHPAKISSSYQIGKSLRFRESEETHLVKTPASIGNRKTWTWSGWVKRGKSDGVFLFGTNDAAMDTYTQIHFDSDDTLRVLAGVPGSNPHIAKSDQQFKDYSSWYHVVTALDTTQSDADLRWRVWVNGHELNMIRSATVSQNMNLSVGLTNPHHIGTNGRTDGFKDFFDGYMADIYFIDGQALTPTDFGEFDSDGIWTPKAYAGTYGTNGFHLDFSDETNLGKDAGGSNDFTANNFTTEATSPFEFESTGFKVGNLASLNTNTNKYVSWNWKEGATPGLDIISYGGTGANRTVDTNLSSPPELILVKDRDGANDWAVYHHKNTSAPETDALLLNSTAATVDDATYWNDTKPGYTKLLLHGDGADGATTFTDSSLAGTHTITVNGDVQVDTAQSKFGGSSLLFDGSGDFLRFASTTDFQFGAEDFTVDFWMRTSSSSDQAIFGNHDSGGSNRDLFISTSLGLVGISADVSSGSVSSTTNVADGNWHHIAVVRSGSNLILFINGVNEGSTTMTGASTDNGISYGIGRTGDYNAIHFNGHLDEFRVSKGVARWTSNFTPPTSAHTVDNTDNGIFLGTNIDVNASGNSYVAYAFDEVPGFSKFGSYTGNGSTDGPFVYTGFKPKYVMIKRSSSSGHWYIYDTARDTFNPVEKQLFTNQNNSELSTTSLDLLSNGFKIRTTASEHNQSGQEMVFVAFAETPLDQSAKAGSVGIASSVRLNDDDSAYLSRTPGSAGNRKTWTWSGWVKNSMIDNTITNLLGMNYNNASGPPYNATEFRFESTSLQFTDPNTGTSIKTSQVFRDPSSFYHVQVAVDTTQGTAADRVKIFVNGEQVTSFSSATYPAQNADLFWNSSGQPHYIGAVLLTHIASTTRYFDGYLSDVYFIDGQALTPSSFGENDTNGYWRPKAYVGTYGTNGFHLGFGDSSDLGNDVSGNDNDWTANNMDATDYVVDTPTNSFAALNSVIPGGLASNLVLSNGGLQATATGSNGGKAVVSLPFSPNTGKYYFETVVNATTDYGGWFSEWDGGDNLGDLVVRYYRSGEIRDSGGTIQSGLAILPVSGGTPVTMGVTVDTDVKQITYYVDNVQQGTPYSYSSSEPIFLVAHDGSTNPIFNTDMKFNFGQGGQSGLTYNASAGGFFKYTPPSGFKALSTANLPVSSIAKPSDYFNAILHTGNGASQSVDVGFAPNLTWIKDRDATNAHMIFDTERPVGAASLTSNSTSAETENFDDTTIDLFVDVPGAFSDAEGEHANYMTLNPLAATNISSNFFASEGNLKLTVKNNDSYRQFSGTMNPEGLKGYYEFEVSTGTPNFYIGFEDLDKTQSKSNYTSAGSIGLRPDGSVDEALADVVTGVTSAFTTGDVGMVAFDFTNGNRNVWYGLNGVWSGDPASGGSPVLTTTQLSEKQRFYFAINTGAGDQVVSFNFGQRPYKYSMPTGFTRLNTMNTPEGNFVPDLVWIKNRSSVSSHAIYDSQRGVTLEINSDSTGAESVETNGLFGFNSGGFNVGSSSLMNSSGANYVAWMWKKGVTPGFDIVTYTGNGSARTVNHSLGKTPAMMIVKNRDTARDWEVWHQGLSNLTNGHIRMSQASAEETSSAMWGGVAPTSTNFSVGTNADTNTSGDKYVSYIWSEVEEFSKFGTYEGNSSTNGPFVYTGFRPAFVMVKTLDSAHGWAIFDSVRDSHNVSLKYLRGDNTDAEVTVINGVEIDMLSNGFKMRGNSNTSNTTGSTYIFAAFAEKPLKYSKGR